MTLNHKIKLLANTQRVLGLATPKWLNELQATHYNLSNAHSIHQDNMKFYSACCFIGELHRGDSDYGDCMLCHDIARIAPHIFGLGDLDMISTGKIAYSNVMTSPAYSAWKTANTANAELNPTTTGIANFLNFCVYHIEISHKRIVKRAALMKMLNGNKKQEFQKYVN